MSLQQSKGIVPLIGKNTGSGANQEPTRPNEHEVFTKSLGSDEMDVHPDNPENDHYFQSPGSMLS
ncbi:MAG: hypothetical protein WCT07_00400 [Candidatus Paceibacterota bacterium]|jgi:hypothetical protein